MDIIDNYILPLLVLGTATGITVVWKKGNKAYAQLQQRITNLELRLHKRELSVRLGGLAEDNPVIKDFFSAYDFLYAHAKDKNAEHFISMIDAVVRTVSKGSEAKAYCEIIEAIIGDAEAKGYKRKTLKGECEKNRILTFQNAIPDKIEINMTSLSNSDNK